MGCSGRCCAVFNYSVTPQELADRQEREGYYSIEGGAAAQRDDKFILDMLVSLSPEEAQIRALRFDVTPPDGFSIKEWAEGYPAYTCRHWDEGTMLCTVYDERPEMCRDYPYGRKCQHDCACDERLVGHRHVKWAAINIRNLVREQEAQQKTEAPDTVVSQ